MRAVGTAAPAREKESETAGPEAGEPWRTILFNCECHTFDQVERQLIKAIRCTLSRARQISMEVHTKGSCAVFSGPRERCEAVAMVLEDIGLVVKVAQ